VAELAELIEQNKPVKVDCGKLVGCDDPVAGQLAGLLSDARKRRVPLTLEQVDAFMARLNERLVAGDQSRAPAWLLLLELLQRHGTQEMFEERAVDYAVTFELSPPSWEATPAVAPEVVAHDAVPHDDACYLSGDLKNCRFEDLVPVLENTELPIIDFSGVRRMDFFSAGQLVNRIAPYKLQGREILIRSPNHLVAELMAVVGLNKQARIIVPKS
jgi:anti-anti-sigma regulatory factor